MGKHEGALTALHEQEGGNHYKAMAIQPIEFAEVNCLGACQTKLVKYVSRHRQKNGAEDLRKAIHVLRLLLDLSEQHEFEKLHYGFVANGVQAQMAANMPYITCHDYTAANRLGSYEAAIIQSACEAPTRFSVEMAIEYLHLLLAEQYGSAA